MASTLAAAAFAEPARQTPLPVIDVHLHASAADSQGPPPLGLCGRGQFPVWDQRQTWGDTFTGVPEKTDLRRSRVVADHGR